MTIRIDPEGNEIAALFDLYSDLGGKSVLEIGSGDGRLTWRYAAEAARVVAIEPDEDKHAAALANRPHGFTNVEFLDLGLEAYYKAYRERFDLAILSWSL
jgi:predicted RNA methylase